MSVYLRAMIGALCLAGLFFLYSVVHAPEKNNSISGIVVPHHAIVSEIRRGFLSSLSPQIDTDTIVLISPNHKDAGEGVIQVSDHEWQTADGVVSPNQAVIEELVALGVTRSHEVIAYEHGITDVMGDIAYAFPHAQIVPLIVKSDARPEDVALLHDALLTSCARCVLVASVDFSHYQPKEVARLHDEKSLRALERVDMRMLYDDAEVDAPAVLSLLAVWAQSHETLRFVLRDHTNSGDLLPQGSTETTTHLFGYYEKGDQVSKEQSLTFMIGGDVILSEESAALAEASHTDEFFEKSARFFWGVDAAIINLEGVFSTSSREIGESMRLLFDPRASTLLEHLHIDAVSMANNHTYDNGHEGVSFTRMLLSELGIAAFGGVDQKTDLEPYVVRTGSKEVVFIAVGMHPDVSAVAARIGDYVQKGSSAVVIAHWGKEFETTHSPQQEMEARAYIDAGAAMVVGSHAHVVQDVSIYRGKPIVYSLGNFMVPQQLREEDSVGMVVAGAFREQALDIFLIPIESDTVARVAEGDAYADLAASWGRPWEAYAFTEGGHRFYRFPYGDF